MQISKIQGNQVLQKLKIQVPQVLASSMVSEYESSTIQGIQEFKYCWPIIATGATVNMEQTQNNFN